MYALNSVETEDDYSEANTLQCPGTVELIITVEGEPILLQYAFRGDGYSANAPVWSPVNGVFLPAGFHTRGRNVEQVRIKSFAKGKPGNVSIEAVS